MSTSMEASLLMDGVASLDSALDRAAALCDAWEAHRHAGCAAMGTFAAAAAAVSAPAPTLPPSVLDLLPEGRSQRPQGDPRGAAWALLEAKHRCLLEAANGMSAVVAELQEVGAGARALTAALAEGELGAAAGTERGAVVAAGDVLPLLQTWSAELAGETELKAETVRGLWAHLDHEATLRHYNQAWRVGQRRLS